MRPILSFSAFLLLSACAYTGETSVQSIHFETPGAEDALCFVYVDGLKYKVRPPQTINISNTKESLVIDCLAPGNRRREVTVEPELAKTYAANAVFLPGALWDSLSGAMYKFPETIEIDFTNIPIQPEPLPAQNNPDIRQPETYKLEEFSPSQPRMNTDRDAPAIEIRKRQRLNYNSNPPLPAVGYNEPDNLKPMGKGDLQTAIDTIDADTSAEQAPAPLYPGQ